MLHSVFTSLTWLTFLDYMNWSYLFLFDVDVYLLYYLLCWYYILTSWSYFSLFIYISDFFFFFNMDTQYYNSTDMFLSCHVPNNVISFFLNWMFFENCDKLVNLKLLQVTGTAINKYNYNWKYISFIHFCFSLIMTPTLILLLYFFTSGMFDQKWTNM